MGTLNAFYVRAATPDAAALVRDRYPSAYGSAGSDFLAIDLAANHFDCPEGELRQLSGEVNADVVWLSFQSVVDAFTYHRWFAGSHVRSLEYVGEQGAWMRVDGQPEPWEASVLFHPGKLAYALEYQDDEADRDAIRSVYLDRRLAVGNAHPSLNARETAREVANHYRLPGWADDWGAAGSYDEAGGTIGGSGASPNHRLDPSTSAGTPTLRVMQVAQPQVQIAALKAVSNGRATAVILVASAVVFAFLCWLLYVKQPLGTRSAVIDALPAVDASLNGVSALLLCGGLAAVLRRRFTLHMRLMFAAACSSALFLGCYLTYHTAHGSTPFVNHGPVIRPVYMTVLASHIVLSAVALPLILASFFLSLSGRYSLHRRTSWLTFPVWLYVSVTGVAVFALLKTFNHP